jgi:hypothetical protein
MNQDASTGLCPFCQKPGKMSDEHIWGDWLRGEIPFVGRKHFFHSVEVRESGEEITDTRIRAGDPLNAQIRVCRDCNHGWMREIQEDARPTLSSMFERDFLLLDRTQQEKLATWVCMSTMASDFLPRHEYSIVSNPKERKFLISKRAPPSHWRIWIAHCEAFSALGQWLRFSFPARLDNNVPKPELGERLLPNSQTTAFVINRIFFFAMSSPANNFLWRWDWHTYSQAKKHLFQIWPVIYNVVPWGLTSMDGTDIEKTGRAVKEWATAIRSS